jgi:hypothetical protein
MRRFFIQKNLKFERFGIIQKRTVFRENPESRWLEMQIWLINWFFSKKNLKKYLAGVHKYALLKKILNSNIIKII